METNKLIAGIVAAAIAVIVLAGVLMPALSNATTTKDTFTNEGGFYQMQEIKSTDDGTYTLEWVKTDTTVLTVNGEDFDAYAKYGEKITTVACGDDWIIRYNSADNEYGYIQFYDGTNWNGGASSKSFTLTASAGSVTITVINSSDQPVVTNETYTTMYAIDPASTDDIMKKPTETPYVLGDSEIYAMGITVGITGLVKISGSIDDGVTVDVLGQSGETVSNIVIDATADPSHVDLYKINKITFDVEISGVTTSCTYNFFIVPYEVTAERSVHLTDAMNVILNVIPLLIIVSVLLAVVAVFILRRE